MIGTALFLISRSMKNRVARGLRRLRQPRYAAGTALAAIYLGSILLRGRSSAGITAEARSPELMLIAISLLALCAIVGVWALPSDEPGLLFTEAEIEFLFPAPITRRQLLAYKTLRTQVAGLLSAAIFSLFIFRSGHYLGIWVGFAFLHVYTTFVSFARARLKLAGVGWLSRLAATAAAFAGIYLIVERQFRGNATVIVKAFQNDALIQSVAAIVKAPPLGAILWFPRRLGMAIYAPTASSLLISCAILLAATYALFFLTIRLDVAFEDASIVASQRAMARGARIRAMRSGQLTVHRFPPPFRLAARGRPEVALIWKNAIAEMRTSSLPLLALILPLLFATPALIFHSEPEVAEVLGFLGLATAAMFALLGPQALRSDLRGDILRLDLLKSFPLSAESLLAAELIAPLLILAIGEALLVAVSIGILYSGSGELPFLTSPEFVVSALVFIVPLCALQLLIQNAAIVLFPAWGSVTAESWSFDVMGQRMLLLAGNLFALIVALIPPAVLFLPSLWIALRMARGPIAVLVAAIPGAAVMVVEIAIAHKLLAWQFDKIDIANDMDKV